MSLLFLFFISVNNDKIVDVRFTEVAPVIDGVIEEVWEIADSACNFVQFSPYEKGQPTERTAVYILQDKENLYFAFRCYAEKHKPIACFTSDEDDIRISIDPFDSKTTAYYFMLYASGIIDDGLFLDDGKRRDNSWDGVWYRAVKLYDDRFEVEVKIPFKSIRYKKGLNEWGINFGRYIAALKETNYWTEYTQLEGDMVSKYGTLRGVDPHATGYYFELYPEAFLRYDKYEGEEGVYKLRGSLNFKWDLTPEMTVNATAYPDFAQIESDPFELNLERYPVYLDERRPFFLEGNEIFRMSDYGEDFGFFEPLDIFYSRRIGKSIDGEVIPILTGLKLTNKSEKWNVGALGAYTDGYSKSDTVIEPRRGFGVFRVERRVLENSDIGMLISGTMADKDDYNYAVGLEGVYRKGFNQFILQGAVSDKSKKRGWALSSGYLGMVKGFLTMVSAEIVQDSFDVSDIGFMPWVGRKQLMAISGPFKTYPKGFFRNLYIAPGILAVQEPGNENWSKLGYFMINSNFRNNWGVNFELSGGPYYEADTNYFYRSIHLSLWGNIAGNHLNFGGNYCYSYNYWRGFLAYHSSSWASFNYSVIPPLRLGLSSNMWIEWDTLHNLIATTPRVTPRIEFRFNADMKVEIFNEFVMTMPKASLSETELLTNRLGLLFSWNFKPKSWLYIALNDYRVQDDEGNLQLENQIGAIKAKYLFYF